MVGFSGIRPVHKMFCLEWHADPREGSVDWRYFKTIFIPKWQCNFPDVQGSTKSIHSKDVVTDVTKLLKYATTPYFHLEETWKHESSVERSWVEHYLLTT